MWTLTYREARPEYLLFACNGQSGKVCGKLPVDKRKLWIFFEGDFVPLLAVLLAAGYII